VVRRCYTIRYPPPYFKKKSPGDAGPLNKIHNNQIKCMNIRLKKLTLTNFKGIRSFSVIFNDITNIFGANTSGKTTLKDAFLWLFFGKDSSDRKDFEIKTLDEHNNPYHNLDHEVEAVIDLDGEEIIIRRSMREKWTKKRGSSTPATKRLSFGMMCR
jgi:DNA repair exonuclease SbcCD ATPase subunit